MEKIGFIGIGIMGAPMAGHLLDAGHAVATATHRTPAPQDLLDKGLSVLENARAVAEASDVIIIMVPDLSLIHISEPTRLGMLSRMPSSA